MQVGFGKTVGGHRACVPIFAPVMRRDPISGIDVLDREPLVPEEPDVAVKIRAAVDVELLPKKVRWAAA